MGGRYKSFNYEISDIPDFFNTISGITPQLFPAIKGLSDRRYVAKKISGEYN